jgi:RNA polymerase sigma-54 factor
MKQGLALRVSQQLALTPQLQQSIRLLQLSTLELSQEIDRLLDENPFLERDEDEAIREAFGVAQDDTPISQGDRLSEWDQTQEVAATDPQEGPATTASEADGPTEAQPEDAAWDGDGTMEVAPDDSEWGVEAAPRQSGEETASATELAADSVSLTEHLHQQASGLRLPEETAAALYALIESLNDDGYLEDDLPTLARAWADDDPATEAQFLACLQDALDELHDMEPLGVGARNLAECLQLQVQALPSNAQTQAAWRLLQEPMALLARRDVKRMAREVALDEDLVRQAMALIVRLEPKPARRFAQTDRLVVVPDVLVVREGDDFKVSLNPQVMPRLRVHDVYASAMKGQKGQAEQLSQHLQEARWFIKNLQQRFDTILRVSATIVQRQHGFFQHGELAMRPMVLREVAERLELHESTVSRVTSGKYMATPQGTYELKFFFGSGLGTETGHSASSTAVRALIRQFIAAESAQQPLSDNQLSVMLKEQGIDCARRTVAKYREAMRIAPANLRKAI